MTSGFNLLKTRSTYNNEGETGSLFFQLFIVLCSNKCVK